MVKQTAGRDALTGFADDFARYNDDVLFGEVWNNPNISLHNRSMITISCLVPLKLCCTLSLNLQLSHFHLLTI